MWARREISRRWTSLVVLGLLAGLVGGLGVAAVAGARRTSTAFERYREATGRADAIVFATLLGVAADYTPVRNLAEVEDAGEFTLAPVGVEGHAMGQLAPNDDRLYRTIARPLLVAGRLGIAETYVMRHTEVEAEGVSLPLFALTPVKGSRTFAVLEGRPPTTADEVVLGPVTARALNSGSGDTLAIGGAETVEARIVGVALLAQSPHFSFDQGGWMTVEGFETVAPDESDGAREGAVAVRFVPGAPVDEGIARLKERLGPSSYIESASLPQDVAFLRNVPTPDALAVFLVMLGLGALGHVVATAVNRRGHDLAVLRALGFRPLQAARCVTWQAVTISLVSLALGIPLGIAAGRWSWRWVAEVTHLLYVPPLATAVVVLSVPGGLLLAVGMAALPSRRAARLRPAEVLRAE